MGGYDTTRHRRDTRNVFLEAAHFAPDGDHRPRRASSACIPTPAHRFERGVDPELPRIAIERATRLIVEIAGGAPGPVVEAVLPEHLPKPRRDRACAAHRLARVLGVRVDDAEVARILHALGMRRARAATKAGT